MLPLGFEFHFPNSSAHHLSPKPTRLFQFSPHRAARRTLPREAAQGPGGISTPPPHRLAPEEAIMKLTGDKTSHRGTVGHLSFSNALLFLPIWLQLVQRYNFQCCSFLVDHTIKVFEKQTALNHRTVRSPYSSL